MAVVIRSTLRKLVTRLGFEQDWYLIVCGAIVGTLTAFGAIGFAKALEWFNGTTTELHAGGELWLLIVLPMGGALLSGFLTSTWAAEAKGHGVPQVLNALIRKNGVIPLRVGIVKVIASILTVGSGGSAGTEGPIIQIGATAGSVFGQRMKISREHMRTLVGCGAAAGIASIFNAPIAGVFFVLEILLRDFSMKIFAPIVVASVFSAATTHAVLAKLEGAGSEEVQRAIFLATDKLQEYHFRIAELPSYVLLGIICGLVAVGFNAALHKAEDLFERVKLHGMLKPMFGAMLLGLLGVGYLVLAPYLGLRGEAGTTPPFYSNGYGTIRYLLNPDSYAGGTGLANAFVLLVLVLIGKCVATCFTLGSGGSGGVFAPSLFMGATAGAAFGLALEYTLLMPPGGSPAAYALVGMAAVVAGSTHAPLTAILILFELTHDVYVLMPIMIAAVISTVVSQLINRDSIYTTKLRRAGILVGAQRDLTLLLTIPVSQVQRSPLPPEAVYASDPVSKLVTLHAHHRVPDFPVVDHNGKYMGLVTGQDMRTALIDREAIPLLLVAELMREDLPTVAPEEMLDTVMDKFAKHDVASLAVVESSNYRRPLGMITRGAVMARYQRALEDA
jgi:CIC family chloride channel protein